MAAMLAGSNSMCMLELFGAEHGPNLSLSSAAIAELMEETLNIPIWIYVSDAVKLNPLHVHDAIPPCFYSFMHATGSVSCFLQDGFAPIRCIPSVI